MTSTQPVYLMDHNTRTTTWDDPQLPSTVDTSVPQYKCDYRRKGRVFQKPAIDAPDRLRQVRCACVLQVGL